MPEQRNIHYCSDYAGNSGKHIGSFKYRLPGTNRDVTQCTVCLWCEFLNCVLLEMSQTFYDIILRSHNIKNIDNIHIW